MEVEHPYFVQGGCPGDERELVCLGTKRNMFASNEFHHQKFQTNPSVQRDRQEVVPAGVPLPMRCSLSALPEGTFVDSKYDYRLLDES